jgi:hypothetical protein
MSKLHKAERKRAKLRVGLVGPSGSGKTYSALLLANGIAPWEKIAIIDTENGSGELYTHLGNYLAYTITDDFAPEKYIEAIKECEQAGIEVIIIDSITHEWNGRGGCLEINEKEMDKMKFPNSFAAWAKTTPRHNAFIDAIIQSKVHIITTARCKTEYVMVDRNGKQIPQKVGMAPITRDGFEFEMLVSFELDANNEAKTSKDRTGLFKGQPDFIINQEVGEKLLAWSESGSADVTKELLTNEQLGRLQDLIKQLEADPAQVNKYILQTKKVGMMELTQEQASEVITAFENKVKLKQEEKSKDDSVVAEQKLDEVLNADDQDSTAKKLMKEGMKKKSNDKA